MKRQYKTFTIALALGLAALTSVGSTYAWFAMKTTIKATGMTVNASVSGSLLIKEDSAPEADYVNTTVALSESGKFLRDSTHDFTVATTTGLMTLSKEERAKVDHASGVYSGSNYIEAVNTVTDIYYYDWTVYIASKNAALENQNIIANLTSATGTVFAHAVAIDFYSDSVKKANYIGTAHATGSTGSTCQVVSGKDVPAANGSAGIKLIMRTYIDGAYLESENILVTTDTFDVSLMSLNLIFISSNAS